MNPSQIRPGFCAACWTACLLLALTGCSGGGGDSSWATGGSSSETIVYISGTVAAGAPVIGSIEARDVKGASKQVQIQSDGSYKFGLKGLTLPLLFRATGHVGGQKIVLVSAATTDDAGKTVNITPFTDLIIANLAGTTATTFFDNPNFTWINPTTLDEARVMVTQRIAPVMSELGVAQDFDLRRTPFAADHTKFDALLDVIRVEVDAATRQAVIRDVINNLQISDDLVQLRDKDPLPTPPTGSYATAIAELIAIDGVLTRLNNLFATAVPAADNNTLLSLFASDFLYGGLALNDFLGTGQLRSSGNIGVQLINPVIISRAGNGSSMRVRVQVLDTKGNVIAYDQVDSDELEFRKDGSGNWRIAGDRRMGDISVTAINQANFGNNSTSYTRAIEFWIPAARSDVAFVQVSGPGLPATTTYSGPGNIDGILFKRNASGKFGLLNTAGSILNSFWIPECPAKSASTPCVTIAQIAPNAAYSVKFLDASLALLGDVTTLRLPMPPAENSEAQSMAGRWFPVLGTPSPGSFGALADNTLFRLSWTNPTDIAYKVVSAGLQADNQSLAKLLAGNETSLTLGPWVGSAPGSAPTQWIIASGLYDREFVTTASYPQ